MQANIKEIQSTIVTMQLYAPFDGTVVEKQGEVGEIISPIGDELVAGPHGRGDHRRPREDGRRDRYLRGLLWRIALGQPASVSVSGDPVQAYSGRLRQVLPMSDRTASTVKVKVEILDPDDKLFPELAATVHFLPSERRQQPRRGPTFLFVPKYGRLPGERARPRLGHRRGQYTFASVRSRSPSPPTTWPASNRG